MLLNPFKLNDFKQEALENITEQFKDKVVFQKYLQLLLTGEQEVITVLQSLMRERSIDTAVGEQLDILGRIVGQERILVGADTFKYFGFEGSTFSSTFGSSFNNSVGGFWYSYGSPSGANIQLNDEQYRVFIKAKIKKNVNTGSVTDVVDFLEFVFNIGGFVISNGGGTATIRVSRKLSTFERSLVEYIDADGGFFIPRPLGVKLIIEEPEVNGTFGFLGTPFALGMVSLYATNAVGGYMGSVFSETE